MTAMLVWILIAASSGGNISPPVVVARFSTKADCEAARRSLEVQTKDSSMKSLYGACVEAKALP